MEYRFLLFFLNSSGWYGKGIYFSSYSTYTLPYIYQKPEPSIIISWVVPGHVYPVIEEPHGDCRTSLKGKALKNGFNSHFVLTTMRGNVYSANLFLATKDFRTCNGRSTPPVKGRARLFLLTYHSHETSFLLSRNCD